MWLRAALFRLQHPTEPLPGAAGSAIIDADECCASPVGATLTVAHEVDLGASTITEQRKRNWKSIGPAN